MADRYENIVDLDHLSLYHDKAKATFATKAEHQTLSGRVDSLVAEGGEPNSIETVKVNGTALTPDAAKAVNVTVPTTVASLTDASNYALAADVPANVSDLTNDSGFQTAEQVSQAVQSAVSTALSSAVTYKGTVATYAQLPEQHSTGDMWNVSSDGMNYVWSGSEWDAQAPTTDLSGLVEKANVTICTNAQINSLFE